MQDFLDEFKLAISSAFDRLSQIGEAGSETPLSPGKWSRKQVLGHLIDSASNNHQRFVRVQIEDNLSLPGYDQSSWVDLQQYKSESWIELVALWRSYNLHLLHVASVMSAKSLRNSCIIAGEESAPLEFVVRDYLRHMNHHLAQILE